MVHYASATVKKYNVQRPKEYPDPEVVFQRKHGTTDRDASKRYPWALQRVDEINLTLPL